MKCEKCKWFKPEHYTEKINNGTFWRPKYSEIKKLSHSGECHFYLPLTEKIKKDVDDGVHYRVYVYAYWPRVDIDDFCKEFSPCP